MNANVTTCDVAVVGLGIFGSATTHALVRRGARVVGIEAHGPIHRFGSSYGESRIFRRAYWEGTNYLPLLNRAHELWVQLEEAHESPLLLRTGGVFAGTTSSGVVELSKKTAEAGGIEHEVLTAGELNSRFPWFDIGDDMAAIYEPDAYAVLAERARLAMLDQAVTAGASLRFGDAVVDIGPSRNTVTLELRSGETIACGAVVLALGPWMKNHLTTGLSRILQPVRVPVYWFRTSRSLGAERFPSFLYETAAGEVIYGVTEGGPDRDIVKIGFHNRQQRPWDPQDRSETEVPREYLDEIHAVVSRIFKGVVPEPVGGRYCYYTLTPDTSFIVDRSPAHAGIVHISACSGHGFKFAPAIGECAAEMVLGLPGGVDVTPFRADRFAPGAVPMPNC
ncbi:N-methyl-L-tryptophan oxidase [Nonomuraea jiangxiensis]|uniref:Sarcosine oxidase n=1 Tax=Nonomuraea jiangxiensis TaxID=633440 RepID=A0A1G8TGC1_9ACTN|nr:N-methyl-L-tryptophan oxidase [Nonomuraea jiangxiensis]SDJ40596.1 sarcosine oxidase [Nonomuraea jiangxiensis]